MVAKKRKKAQEQKAEARIESKVFIGGAAIMAVVGLWYFASGGSVDAIVEDLLVTEVASPVIPVDLNFPTYVEVDYKFPTYVEVGAHFAIPEVEEVVVEEVVDVETELN